MIAFREEFERINLATTEEGLANIILNEYDGISADQCIALQTNRDKTTYLFLELEKQDLAKLLAKYDDRFSYKLFQLELDGCPVSFDEIPDISEFISHYLSEDSETD